MVLSLISSSSSSVPQQIEHEVFISFRGEDTRNNFTSHLHKALRDKQIQAFIDDELDRGNEISSSLVKAIEESQISIIIFSKTYASSKWCLEELVKILECKRRYGQTVIPVFYRVDPSEVRNQTGAFGDAFTKHEDHFKENLDKVQRWKDALNEAANLSGWHSTAMKIESKLIEDIVKDILKMLNNMPPSDNKDLIGIDTKIKEIISQLNIGIKDSHILGIWGTGGIGKTTLAKAIYSKISWHFEGHSFIPNVREELEQGGLNRLREQLFLTILGDRNMNMGAFIMRQHNFTMNRLGRKNILIVFDDVSDFRQIEYLIGNLNYLNPQSRIIITSRDKQVLRNCGVNQWYEVQKLFHHEALELFRRYAFKGNNPTKDYIEPSERVVGYAGGIPLALKILGSSLLGKSKEVWDDTIEKLEKIIDRDIQKVLEISYHELDDEVKKIFLDIAIFFNRNDVGVVKQFFEACGFSRKEHAISILIDKSLIAISYDRIEMHDLIQAMAKEIVRRESVEDPSKRSRLWDHEDIYSVLTKNMGAETIEGISLDVSKVKAIKLNPLAFSKMQKLRVLNFYSSCWSKMSRVNVVNDIESDFTELKYLHWHEYPLTSLSSNFCPQNLVVLEMPYSNVTQLWDGVQVLPNLKRMDFSWSRNLTCIPDLSQAPNLEDLLLRDCTSLTEIPSSIQHLVKLVILNLMSCGNLWKFPASSDAMSRLKNLDSLSIRRSKCREQSSLQLHHLLEFHHLGFLYLDNCGITDLPESLGLLSSVRCLRLNGNNLESIPETIIHLSRLIDLDISYCERLLSLPELPRSLRCLSARNCKSLQALSNLSTPPANLDFDYMRFSFINCFNLNQNAIRDIVKNVLLEILSKVVLRRRNRERALERGLVIRIEFPGDEIPEWFSFQCLGSSMRFKLSPDWFNDAFFGFALCIVVSVCDQLHNDCGLCARFECKVRMPDGDSFLLIDDQIFSHGGSLEDYGPSYVGADHVLLDFYEVQRDDFCGKYFNDDISFQIYRTAREPINCCKVKKCGVRLMYEKDFIDSGESFNFNDNCFWKSTEESSTSRRFRFEEPDPKRSKLMEFFWINEPDPKRSKLMEFLWIHDLMLNQ